MSALTYLRNVNTLGCCVLKEEEKKAPRWAAHTTPLQAPCRVLVGSLCLANSLKAAGGTNLWHLLLIGMRSLLWPLDMFSLGMIKRG